MSTVAVQVFVVSLFALTCGLLALAYMRGWLGRAAIALFVIALTAWIASFALLASDLGNADEFATCGENCTVTQYATSVAFIGGPLLLALAGLAMLVARGTRWQRRRTRENHP